MDLNVGLYCNGGTQTVTTWCSTNCTSSSGVARVTKWYGQIGGAAWTSASYAVSPYFVISTINGNPAMLCVSANSTYMTATITTINDPLFTYVTFSRTANFTSFANWLYNPSGNNHLISNGAANQVQFSGGPLPLRQQRMPLVSTDFAAAHWHNVLGYAVTAGTTNSIYVDGAVPVTVNPGFGVATGTTAGLCGNSSFADGYIPPSGLFQCRASGSPECYQSVVCGVLK